MNGPRYEADDPREWLNRANSNLRLAKSEDPAIYLEELCYNAQQAAEKAVKAVFLKRQIQFPYTHNLARLLQVLSDAGVHFPPEVGRAEDLTRFAFEARYPSVAKEVTETECTEAIEIASAVVQWARDLILCEPPKSWD